MNVWYAIPSKRPPAEANALLAKWRERGYKVAVWRDHGDEPVEDMRLLGTYPGYARAVNALCTDILQRDPDAQWIVTGGDDVYPDPHHTAEEIGQECTAHFGGTFGVMQPIGDGHGIETIAGSPWMGRDWCGRINGGHGPLWPEYFHCFGDNELQEVALRLCVFWQRADLIHKHDHWSWTTGVMPSFLADANSTAHWQKYKGRFLYRMRDGFPGHTPLPA